MTPERIHVYFLNDILNGISKGISRSTTIYEEVPVNLFERLSGKISEEIPAGFCQRINGISEKSNGMLSEAIQNIS